MKSDSSPELKIHVLPGGKMPKRQTLGAIGYDVHVRGIVSPWEMEPKNQHLRKMLFNFGDVVDQSVERFIDKRVCEKRCRAEPVYRLEPGRRVLCGIGFATEMPFPLCYLTLCRSGLASKHDIMVANGPGTIDPDYRGEAGIILFNTGDESFYLYRNMRIAQILFIYAVIPQIKRVKRYDHLDLTPRGPGGFGSTGLR
ncbi:MAG: hypothetical protein A3C79_02460 [Candidatus Taylorbacteria bacterium RIFCSPHIGHO2_02_FULL_45_28]|uniref:dUTP diphosphatase n=1 Tax=Candidatus Taylorbacteria bacterium RIFCSPHIGHO2_12_FULL_45_16 TaxID=1802315 RepID=A0A1G2MY51_9BACT|nr:MAG: hypothetical protein A2830_03265 [Candidatus Taylorbacteria bacterium RIFCSPHIGHO2_01_FULL_44_110]OHA25316.1 MAG: hypothetical protein A3C79_02460 [Candidatus Taylorbacteria bacterium RIFCSPHIGHO2_02_FULL_45_28]OHA28703.1 MAG: hypothetical protein A3F51_02925 [Candidatus Taylorbacteria bacterium RIFCSPHIGHO2_12_FULL_45_16]OHA32977.1 MAG: hypothetical protein A3A23_01105 [Candidatus Taylorbacteria bacterium RIFCSPLOWO2_01_FULL_45_59]OHA38467.1 MAG: hypothetical protein A3I98_00615 [Candi